MLVLNEWGAFVRAFLKCKIRSSSVSAARTSVQKHLKNTGGNRDTHATGRDENTVTSDREYFGTYSGVPVHTGVFCAGLKLQKFSMLSFYV